MKLKWTAFSRMADLVGCDIETMDNSGFYRGPIKSIVKSGNRIVITTHWMARRLGEGLWENWHVLELSVSTYDPEPILFPNSRITIEVPCHWVGTIFLNGSKLDPAKVNGLDLTKAA